MDESTLNTLSLITTLGFSATSTVEAIIGGFKTPLIDTYNLRPHIEDILAANPEIRKRALKSRNQFINDFQRSDKGRRVLGQYKTLPGSFIEFLPIPDGFADPGLNRLIEGRVTYG